jgi:hypothetical protein
MVRTLILSAVVSLLAVACASEPSGDDVPEGYTRFEPPPITVAPGESGQWVQYVANPFDVDMDVVDIIGHQGPGGHHAVLYSSPTIQEVGFTREFSTLDQVADRFLGGLGGEGAEEIALPEGAVFRVPAGQALYINVHYFNAGTAPLEGWSQLDVKFEPASEDQIAVGLFANVTLGFNIEAGTAATVTTGCTVERDISLVMFTNHMHEYGVAAKTEIVPPGTDITTPVMLKDDPEWNYEWATNPNFERHSVAEPMVIPAGTLIQTTCEWDNTTADNLMFPDEMCLFLSFHIDGTGDVSCVDGDYGEAE